jgi:endonuclease YncB( thermonuclease family)
MKKNIKENWKPVVLIVVTLVLTAISAHPQRKFAGRVVEVVDGKTCVIALPAGRVTAELQYIEIPDPDQPLYQSVKEHLQKLVLDKKVEFLPRGVMVDRTVGQVFVGGVDVSQQMLRDGAAWHSIPEKSGQDSTQSLVYQDNETQAKTEKRGVWGVPDMKPVWEFRIEQAALRQKQKEEEARRNSFVNDKQQARRKPPLPKPQPAPQAELWAEVGGASQYEQPLGFGGMRGGFDPASRRGHISTPGIFLDFPKADFLQNIESRLFYLYQGDKKNIEDGTYVVAFLATAKDFRFIKSNNLTITADAEKIALGKAKRFFRQNGSAVQELLLYKITRADLLKIVKAEKIGVQIANYKGGISSESLAYINNLLKAS